MNIVKASYQILTDTPGIEILRSIERAGRTCYKSEVAGTDEATKVFVKNLIARGHEAMLEHTSISVLFITDRGVSHEIVRHRIASFAQESTRYCNYTKDKFGNEITVLDPIFFHQKSNMDMFDVWLEAMENAEKSYFKLIELGATAQEARTVLPNSLKTEIVVTANVREWRHFFELRAVGITGKPHPQMLELTVPLLSEFKDRFPVIFDDIAVGEN